MDLRTTFVSKSLDRKIKIMGFEVFDLLTIFMTISVLNFLFGGMSYQFLLIWLPTIILSLTLYYGKRGKPDNYLIHWLRYQFSPSKYSAFQEPTSWVAFKYKRKING